MGVNQLWNILEPVKREGNLSSLSGKTLCVDLSGWICEAHGAKGLKTNVLKPHLRNLFFHVWRLTRSGVKLVFVVDGEAPEVKWEAIVRRNQARGGRERGRGRGYAGNGQRRKVGRSNFNIWVNECTALLSLLGVPFVESAGEAEALCAWLDAQGIVDGCITNDGDAFLYGARTVYKDLSISAKECSMEYFSMEDIKSKLGLDREQLVALAVLLGCDYLPQGVPGVGKEMCLKLVNVLSDVDLIQRFHDWHCASIQDGCISNIEKTVKKKALKVQGFPSQQVISEFLSPKITTKRLSIPSSYSCPDVKGLEEFCVKYLEWPEDYTNEKVQPLLTYWQMNAITTSFKDNNEVVLPERILKARVQQKVECYEVLWRSGRSGETCRPFFATLETKSMFRDVYPVVAEEFEAAQQEKRGNKTGKRGKKKTPPDTVSPGGDPCADICSGLGSLSLAGDSDDHPPTVEKKHERARKTENTSSALVYIHEKTSHAEAKCESRESEKHESRKPKSKLDDVPTSTVASETLDSSESEPEFDWFSASSEFDVPLFKRLCPKKGVIRESLRPVKELKHNVDAIGGLTNLEGMLEGTAEKGGRECEQKKRHTKDISKSKKIQENTLEESKTCKSVQPSCNEEEVKGGDSFNVEILYVDEILDDVDSGFGKEENECENQLKYKVEDFHKFEELPDCLASLGKDVSAIWNSTHWKPEFGSKTRRGKETAYACSRPGNVTTYFAQTAAERLEAGEIHKPNHIRNVDPTPVSNCKRSGKKLMREVYFSSSESSDDDLWNVDGVSDKKKGRKVESRTVRVQRKCYSLSKENNPRKKDFASGPSHKTNDGFDSTGEARYSVKPSISIVNQQRTSYRSFDNQLADESGSKDSSVEENSVVSVTGKCDGASCIDFPGRKKAETFPSTPVAFKENGGTEIPEENLDSPFDEVFVPLSLSERLGKNLNGRKNVLRTLRSLSTNSEAPKPTKRTVVCGKQTKYNAPSIVVSENPKRNAKEKILSDSTNTHRGIEGSPVLLDD